MHKQCHVVASSSLVSKLWVLSVFTQSLHKCGVKMEQTWYDSSPWADVFINNVFSTLLSSDGRKISLKDVLPLGGIT